MYKTKDDIDKNICYGIAPGLESRYTLLHKVNVSRLCCAVLGGVVTRHMTLKAGA